MSRVQEDVIRVLAQAVIVEGNMLRIVRQLERKEYLAVNEVLESLGGRWNRKLKAHVFDGDPSDKLATVVETGEYERPKDFDFFPTPDPVIERMMELAGLAPEHTVLEPSAGTGAILRRVCEVSHLGNVECVELVESRVRELRERFPGVLVHHCDFLTIEPRATYDRIIMNPPFSRQQDIDHVLHAYKFLKPGGHLVAVMSIGVMFRVNQKTVQFRELLERVGHVEVLPEGAFKDSGTMVRAVLVVMNR